jgi:hypothetical protein
MGTGGPSPLKTPTAFGTYQILLYFFVPVKREISEAGSFFSASETWYTFRDSNPGHPD